MKTFLASLTLASFLAAPAFAQDAIVDHVQTVLDEALERPIVTGTSDGGSTAETVNTESGWEYPDADHPAYRPPFLADGGE